MESNRLSTLKIIEINNIYIIKIICKNYSKFHSNSNN